MYHQVTKADVDRVLAWGESDAPSEVPFIPARVILQDFTGVPAVVDFAAMRDAVKALGGDPERVNPRCPSDLVIDHSVQVGGWVGVAQERGRKGREGRTLDCRVRKY